MKETKERLQNIEQYHENMEKLEQSYLDEKESQQKMFESKNDIRMTEDFWSEAEKVEIEVLE